MSKLFKVSIARLLFSGLLYLGTLAGINAQGMPVSVSNSNDYNWKTKPEIQQIVQQELNLTNNALVPPNLTDWNRAMLEAYRSLLMFTQAEMLIKDDNMFAVLDNAFGRMQTESVPNPAARAMVMDDMKHRQTELRLMLTNH